MEEILFCSHIKDRVLLTSPLRTLFKGCLVINMLDSYLDLGSNAYVLVKQNKIVFVCSLILLCSMFVRPACLKVLGLPPFRNVMLQRAIMSVALFNSLFVSWSWLCVDGQYIRQFFSLFELDFALAREFVVLRLWWVLVLFCYNWLGLIYNWFLSNSPTIIIQMLLSIDTLHAYLV